MIPDKIIERAKGYRSDAFERRHGVWESWCDGSQGIKGHFHGIDVKSFWVDSIEIKLCRDCLQAIDNMNKEIQEVTEETESYTYIVILPDKTLKRIEGVFSFWVDAELKILYLKDGSGKYIAVFNEWIGFEVE